MRHPGYKADWVDAQSTWLALLRLDSGNLPILKKWLNKALWLCFAIENMILAWGIKKSLYVAALTEHCRKIRLLLQMVGSAWAPRDVPKADPCHKKRCTSNWAIRKPQRLRWRFTTPCLFARGGGGYLSADTASNWIRFARRHRRTRRGKIAMNPATRHWKNMCPTMKDPCALANHGAIPKYLHLNDLRLRKAAVCRWWEN